MRIITCNVNGIRSAGKKGFFDWLAMQAADVVCLQETKAHMSILQDPLYYPLGYHTYYVDAEKKGYSGVGIYTLRKPDRVVKARDWQVTDMEGRFLQVDFGSLSIVSIYFPSGSSGPVRQAVKFEFMKQWQRILSEMLNSGRSFVVCGDWNIVHRPIDIKNFKSNQKHSGCLPEERAWIDNLFTHIRWVDAFRVINQAPDQYTWWSQRGRAREKNVGWRIDYQIVTPDLTDKIKHVAIYTGQKFSDHAPLIVDYDVN